MTFALAGRRLRLNVGFGSTAKLIANVAVPPGVVTRIRPVVAPFGTVAVTSVADSTVNTAATPSNVTALAPVRCVPVIVTTLPGGPIIGATVVMVGEGAAVGVGGCGTVAVAPGVGVRVAVALGTGQPSK